MDHGDAEHRHHDTQQDVFRHACSHVCRELILKGKPLKELPEKRASGAVLGAVYLAFSFERMIHRSAHADEAEDTEPGIQESQDEESDDDDPGPVLD